MLYLNIASRRASSQKVGSRPEWCSAARVAAMRVWLTHSAREFSWGWYGVLVTYFKPIELYVEVSDLDWNSRALSERYVCTGCRVGFG